MVLLEMIVLLEAAAAAAAAAAASANYEGETLIQAGGAVQVRENRGGEGDALIITTNYSH